MTSCKERHLSSRRFVQLMWTPRRGDRVVIQGSRYTVALYKPGRGFRVWGPRASKWFLPYEAEFRPSPQDYYEIVLKLQERGCLQYLEKIGADRFRVGFRCNGRVIPMVCRSQQILTHVLSMRMIDLRCNSAINSIFEGRDHSP